MMILPLVLLGLASLAFQVPIRVVDVALFLLEVLSITLSNALEESKCLSFASITRSESLDQPSMWAQSRAA